ncbi:pitrilysin family protein [Mycoavidus sp. B2-EB]|uniref:M16 family metallopeptidase n=1 Tax=Mycoavidus sp. B2-EB TaxID=2651972 RepID=UPI00162517D0|nr:pitrilysin family protein [Mycoavidus sp. B2-EB]BBO60352.1 peptidase M16 [Mycoavidus sp. B2-EB]
MRIRTQFLYLAFATFLAAIMLGRPSAVLAEPLIQQWRTTSGAKVLLVEDHAIPMLDIQVNFDAGSRYDPPSRSGLAAMTARILRTGTRATQGCLGLTEAQIENHFADLGGVVSDTVDEDSAALRLRTLSIAPKRDAALATFAALLQCPSFPEKKLAREKQRIITVLKERSSRPQVQAEKTFSAAVFGAHPYGASPDPKGISTLTPAALSAFYRTHYDAQHAVLSIVGDCDRLQAERIAEQLMRALPPGAPRAVLPPVVPLASPREIKVPNSALQAHILLGAPAIARGDPDYFALLVANQVLGGGTLISRLGHEVREQRGLSYGVYSTFVPAAQPGRFQISLQTQKDQVPEALAVVRATLAKFIAQGPTQAELEAAKNYLVNSFPLQLDSNGKRLGIVATIGFYGLPLDYLNTWTARVNAVTREEAQAVFAKHVNLDKMVTVLVGAPE